MSPPLDDDVVDVVVPVYGNLDDARRLFASLAAATTASRFRLVVVDDASPVPAATIIPAAGGRMVDVVSIRNARNIGFAGTVNEGLRLGRRDVVLLNTDTLVFDGWLDGLCAAARSAPRVATVTPLSNAATIVSYPTFPHEFKSSLELDWRAFAALCARIGAAPVPIPTGVGFCLYVTRAAIDRIGTLDADAFPIGYGEECDFCRRAVAAGWSNLAAPNVFVWHRGEGSFGARAAALRDEAQAILRARHPDYPETVNAFIRADPLLSARRALDVARLHDDPRPVRLHLGVGAPDAFAGDTKALSFARRGGWWPRYTLQAAGFASLANLPDFSPVADMARIERFLVETKIAALVTYPRQGRARLLFRRFRHVARRLGLPCMSAPDANGHA